MEAKPRLAAAPAALLAASLALVAAGCASGRKRLPDIPTAEMMPEGVDMSQVHFTVPTVREGGLAPDFTLPRADGTGTVSLSSFRGRPLVLVFGSGTCGPFRRTIPKVEAMKTEYSDVADFLMVYIREAHASDEWRMDENDEAGWSVEQPKSCEARVETAREFAEKVHLAIPLLVDDVDDAVSIPYGGWPGRFYLIDAGGMVLYRSEVGPFGFRPAMKELPDCLESLRGAR